MTAAEFRACNSRSSLCTLVEGVAPSRLDADRTTQNETKAPSSWRCFGALSTTCEEVPDMAERTCSIPMCHQPVRCRGWCSRHYSRWQRTGDPMRSAGPERATVPLPPIERMWRYIERLPSGCWRWTGAIDKSTGYARMQVDGSCRQAHRISYELLVEPIPDGLHIDHLCRTRACVNPAHLEPVTPAENTRRGAGHGSETHCPQGHPYGGENLLTYTDPAGVTRRYCRTCRQERAATAMATRCAS